MRRRPLCVVLVCMILGILCNAWINTKEPVSYERESIHFLCELEEFVKKDNGYTLVVRDVKGEDSFSCKKIKLYANENTAMPKELHIGNLLAVTASIHSFEKPGNPGQFDEYKYNTELGIIAQGFAGKIEIKKNTVKNPEDFLHRLRNHLQDVVSLCCDEKTAGIVSAMVLGDKSGLSDEVKQLYQENGIAHVLAISGLHISLIGASLFFVLRKYFMPMQGAAVVTMVLLFLYGILTGFSISTQRAVIMMGCMLLARLAGRHYDGLSALSFSAICQLLIHPMVLFQTGFLLSYGTVLGIYVFVDVFCDAWESKNPIWMAVAGTAGIELVTLPILLTAYYEFSILSIAANVLFLPFMGGILVTSLAGIGLGSITIFAGKFCFGFAHFCFMLFEWIGNLFVKIPGAVVITGKPAVWQVFLYYGCGVLFLFLQKWKQKKIFLLTLAFGVFVLFLPIHNNFDLQITNLDVGQGDCSCIRTKNHTFLIDGGSSDVNKVGKYRMIPFLKSQGISYVSYLFLTHSDKDHTNGAVEWLCAANQMGVKIGTVILPKLNEKEEAYCTLLDELRKKGCNLMFMQRGDTVTIDELRISCLHPYPDYEWKSANDSSLVLKVNYQNFTGLFTGDLEEAGEKEIINKLSHVNYLKVAHHGSKGASSEIFLEQVKPDVSVISCGKKNRYGHPHKETLKRLENIGSKVYRTDKEGAVSIECQNGKWYLSLWKKESGKKRLLSDW